jgi:hypothetical protein
MSRDIAIFIGRQFYSTPDEYIEESERLGCCRKVPAIPQDIVIGESKVVLLHRQEQDAPALMFGYYTVDGIIKCSLQQQLTDEIREISAQPVTIPALRAEHRRLIPQRGCGGIDPPSYYLVGPGDVTAELGLRTPTLHIPPAERIHVFDNWIELGDVKHFRGFRYLDSLMEELNV